MAERSKHLFQFVASAIASAARTEAEYHRERLDHWQRRETDALQRVEGTCTVEIQKIEVTGGNAYRPNVNMGDQAAWNELLLASDKVHVHARAVERFEQAAGVYGTQGERIYDLDPEDVEFYRLGNQPRED